MEAERAEAAHRWGAMLADEAAHAARVEFARTTTDAFEAVGQYLYLAGHVLRDEGARAVSLASRIGGALGRGTCDLLDAGNAYGGAALLRQLVEVEYLLWTFSDDAEDASRWLHASKSQLDGRFRPEASRRPLPHVRVRIALRSGRPPESTGLGARRGQPAGRSRALHVDRPSAPSWPGLGSPSRGLRGHLEPRGDLAARRGHRPRPEDLA